MLGEELSGQVAKKVVVASELLKPNRYPHSRVKNISSSRTRYWRTSSIITTSNWSLERRTNRLWFHTHMTWATWQWRKSASIPIIY